MGKKENKMKSRLPQGLLKPTLLFQKKSVVTYFKIFKIEPRILYQEKLSVKYKGSPKIVNMLKLR